MDDFKLDDFQKRVVEKLDRIEAVNDKQNENIHEINITLTKQYNTLLDHTRRSLANEENIELLRKQVEPVIEAQIFRKKLFEYLGLLSLVATVVYSIWKFFQ